MLMRLSSACNCSPRKFVADAGPSRRDPTGTASIRKRFAADLDRRWSKVRRAILETVGQADAFGLGTTNQMQTALMMQTGGHTMAFKSWLEATLHRLVLDPGVERYIHAGFDSGVRRAQRLVKKSTHVTFGTAVSDVVREELQGIVAVVTQQSVRKFYDGKLQRHRSSVIARSIVERVRAIGVARSRALASFSVVRAHALGSIEVFREANVNSVGIIPEHLRRTQIGDAKKKAPSGRTVRRIRQRTRKLERLEQVEVLTAGDEDVCPECEDIASGGPYDINTALGLIPAHPNCRCAFVPAEDERFADPDEDE